MCTLPCVFLCVQLGLVFYGLDQQSGFQAVTLRSSALFMSLSVLTSMPYGGCGGMVG